MTDHVAEKGVPGARSTDLIFLKSVVLTNTLERPKKVCVFNFLLLAFRPCTITHCIEKLNDV